jgi:hypothetical protein
LHLYWISRAWLLANRGEMHHDRFCSLCATVPVTGSAWQALQWQCSPPDE